MADIKSLTDKPNKHIMAIVTFLLLLPLVYFIPEFAEVYVSEDRLIITIFSVAVIVPLLTYLLIPASLSVLKAIIK